MFTLTNIVTEVFNKAYPFEISHKAKGDVIYDFKTDTGKQGKVFFSSDIPNPTHWEVSFMIDRSMNITGGGEEFPIFATVIKIIEEFVKQQSPKILEFSASKGEDKSTSRIDLYNRMISKMAGKAGYEFKRTDQTMKSVFILTKK
jgi:hypothetical protein